MRSKDQNIAALFAILTGLLFVISIPVMLNSAKRPDGGALPFWVGSVYTAMLFGSAVAVLFSYRRARVLAICLLLGIVYLCGSVVFEMGSEDILGGRGPDANPVAGVIIHIMAAFVGLMLVAVFFIVWLLSIRRVCNACCRPLPRQLIWNRPRDCIYCGAELK